MKFILFFFFIVTVLSGIEVTTYRCQGFDGHSMYEAPAKHTGSLYLIEDGGAKTAQYGGWDHQEETKGPFMAHAWNDGNEEALKCRSGGRKGENPDKVEGELNLVRVNESSTLTISCKIGQDQWDYKQECEKAENIYKTRKDVAISAKYLLDKDTDTEKFALPFKPANLIYYSILDYPYVKDNCRSFFHERFKDHKLEDGAIIVSEEKELCAIVYKVDGEEDKEEDKKENNYIYIYIEGTKVKSKDIGELEKHFGINYRYRTYKEDQKFFSLID